MNKLQTAFALYALALMAVFVVVTIHDVILIGVALALAVVIGMVIGALITSGLDEF